MRSYATRLYLQVSATLATLCASAMMASAAGALLGIVMEPVGPGEEGVFVKAVVQGEAAAKAGIQVGDIVTHIGKQKVKSKEELVAKLKESSPGDTLKIQVLRANQERQLEVKLGKRPVEDKREGLMNVKAPEIEIKQWHNLPKGKTQLELADYKDKTVFLYCFQSW
jgi:C-terminal processing protease CtpA/Prc